MKRTIVDRLKSRKLQICLLGQVLVPQRPEVAHRMRGSHQRGQAATRPRPLPL
jgi:hypothetical protein